MGLTFLVTIALTLFILPSSSFACSCVPPDSPEKELERSAAVFSGKVIDIQDRNINFPTFSSADPLFVRFEVDLIWKGVTQSQVIASTMRDSASCGFEFIENNEYLVYATEVDGELQVTMCSRTSLLSSAQDDIKVLGTGEGPTEKVELTTKTDDTPSETKFNSGFTLLIFGAVILVLAIVLVYIIWRRKK